VTLSYTMGHFMIRRIIYLLLLVGSCLGPFSMPTRAAGGSRLEQVIQTAEAKKTKFSIYFYDPATDKPIYAHNPDTPLIPASNMKLITTAAALDQLGPDFSYQTRIALWQGNLVVLAAGDPLTGDPVIAQRRQKDIYAIFQDILEQLRQRKITALTGDLLIDDTIFDDQRFHPSWPVKQSDKWYTAQISALNFNDNCIDVNFAPAAQPGQIASYTLCPDTKYVNIENECKTISSGSNKLGGRRPQDTNNITLFGKCRYSQTINVTIDRPSAYFGFVLAEYLLRNGIDINGKLIIKNLRDEKGRLPGDLEIFLTHTTPIREVLPEANRRSLNMVAECLFKTLGAYFDPNTSTSSANPAQGSWPRGRLAVEAFLKKLSIDPALYQIDDGSGMSYENRLSARCITRVLAYMLTQPTADLYRESMATPEDGTLAKHNRFSEPQYDGRIFAKTGFLNRAVALSGYAKTESGGFIIFSLITNDHTQNPIGDLDTIVKEIIK